MRQARSGDIDNGKQTTQPTDKRERSVSDRVSPSGVADHRRAHDQGPVAEVTGELRLDRHHHMAGHDRLAHEGGPLGFQGPPYDGPEMLFCALVPSANGHVRSVCVGPRPKLAGFMARKLEDE